MFQRHKLLLGELTCYKVVIWRFGLLRHWHHRTHIQGASVAFFLFVQDIVANINVFTILWTTIHTSWSISVWWLVLSVSRPLQWSEELWGGWSSFWVHHQVILCFSLLVPSVWVAFCTGIWKHGWSPYPMVANGLCNLGGKI